MQETQPHNRSQEPNFRMFNPYATSFDHKQVDGNTHLIKINYEEDITPEGKQHPFDALQIQAPNRDRAIIEALEISRERYERFCKEWKEAQAHKSNLFFIPDSIKTDIPAKPTLN